MLSPLLAENEIRIILTWNDRPEDLEAHLTVPSESGCRYHCYYFEKNIPTASLDLDDRNGYGPETITLTDRVSGTYRYYVHDFTNRYSNSYWLARSGAVVKVFYGDREPLVFNVPNSYGNVWHVFDLDGSTGEITPVHSMSRQSEPGRIDYPVITSGAPGSVYWNSPYKYQVKATDPDNDVLTYSLTEAPEGMTIDPSTGLIEWTPSGTQMGYYNVTARVDDGRCGEATQSFRIYVNSYPTIQYSVSPCSGFNPGGDITLTWSTTRATTVLIDQGIGEVEPNGSLTIPSPDEPVVFTLTAFNDAALTKRTVPLSPSASFYFSPRYISKGESTTLTWNPQCFTDASIDHKIGEIDSAGSLEITPTETTTYYLALANAAAERKYSATVVIQEPPPPPRPTAYFNVSPTCNVTPGDPLTLSWSTTNADNVSISELGDVDLNGSLQIFPTSAGSYTITATGPGGTTNRSVNFPNYPGLSFYATAYGIELGDSVTLQWHASCADTVSMNQGVGELPLTGSLTVTPQNLPITYTVTATNERGPVSRNITLYQPAPYGRLIADPTTMKVGDSATLTWTSTRASSCSISPDIGPVSLNGSMTVTPTKPTTYRLTTQGPGGTHTSYANVGFVYPMADLKASATTITQGETVKLTWIYANATTSVIDQGIGEVELGGERTVAPTTTTTYKMTASGPGGTVTDSVTITVIPSDQPPIVHLSVSPGNILAGNSTVLSWDSSYADQIIIEPDIGLVDTAGSITVFPGNTTAYTVTATGPGGTIIERMIVTVIHPSPALTLTVEPAGISAGESAVLSWESTGADTVTFNQGIGTVPSQGSLTVSPEVTTQFTATANGLGGSVSHNISVTVDHPDPVIHFDISPLSLQLGETATLSWNTENAETVAIRPNIGDVQLDGTIEVTPTNDTTYYITATGVDSVVVEQASVTVIHPKPTVSFSATPPSIQYGDSATLTWSTNNAKRVHISPDIGAVNINGTLAVSPTESTEYTITVIGPGGTVTEHLTVEVAYPEPTASLAAIPTSIIEGDTSLLAWNSENAETCTLDPDIGAVPCSGELTVSPTQNVNYTLTAVGKGGTVTSSQMISVTPASPITLTLSFPVDGTVVTRSSVLVTGTITHEGGLETGVTVNGIVALVDNGQFVANHVPLNQGENTLSVVATDVNGEKITQSITLNAELPDRNITINAHTESGLASLQALLSFGSSFSTDAPLDISYTGAGEVQFVSGTEEDTWEITMIEPGIYIFTAELQDEDGSIYTDSVAIQVYDRVVLDTLLQAKWEKMKQAMLASDHQVALKEFAPHQQQIFEEIFSIIESRMAQIASEMQPIELVYQKNDTAEYRIKRDIIFKGIPESVTHYIYFQKGVNGIWKIRDF
ncbi:putative Ig domain-containing protein [Desulfogranum japonicum]|uniref:putative Ig domain-containing protein n=1 Tax=Desulfogranum japonicum TaxID=231447 RepID=UPI0004209F7D|nr:putative Ig domain-containing protein [Desulfogranum japonicum]